MPVTSQVGQTSGCNPKEEKQAACLQVQPFAAFLISPLFAKKRRWVETGHGFPWRKANCLNHLWLFYTPPPLLDGQILQQTATFTQMKAVMHNPQKHTHMHTHTGRRQRRSKELVTIFAWWNRMFHQQRERNNIGLRDSRNDFSDCCNSKMTFPPTNYEAAIKRVTFAKTKGISPTQTRLETAVGKRGALSLSTISFSTMRWLKPGENKNTTLHWTPHRDDGMTAKGPRWLTEFYPRVMNVVEET